MTSETMRAWTFTTRGPPSSVLKLRSDLPRPSPSDLRPNEVLVRITHVGIFQGFAALMAILPHFTSTPWIPATDFSGLIVATGSGVTHVVSGDAVFGSPDPKRYLRDTRYNGVLVEYAILPGSAVVRKPVGMSFASAAGLGGNGCTAVQFCGVLGLRRGMKVLVTGASGSTGSLTLQVVRAVVGKEGSVWGTCSGVNEELVKGLGADGVSRSEGKGDRSSSLKSFLKAGLFVFCG
jgi:NADPH:quinone reductase-like Zn-dependent oxidoreductase